MRIYFKLDNDIRFSTVFPSKYNNDHETRDYDLQAVVARRTLTALLTVSIVQLRIALNTFDTFKRRIKKKSEMVDEGPVNSE